MKCRRSGLEGKVCDLNARASQFEGDRGCSPGRPGDTARSVVFPPVSLIFMKYST